MKLKKMLAGFMTLCMMATAVPVTALAEEVTNEPVAEEVVNEPAKDAVAKIGETTYETLAAALEAAEEKTGDVTITLLNDIKENVTVTQVDGLYLTIDGNDNQLTGMITIIGCGQNADTSLTLQEFNFEAAGSASINPAIKVPSGPGKYTNQITVKDCSFSNTAEVKNAIAIKQNTSGCTNWVIENCAVAEEMFSLLQVERVIGLEIKRCTVESPYGVQLKNSDDVEIINNIFDVKGYAVAVGNKKGGHTETPVTITLTGNTITTESTAIHVLQTTNDAELTLSNNTVTAKTYINKYGSEEVVVRDDGTNKWCVEGAVAEVGGFQYATLAEAVEAAGSGDTVTLLKDAEGSGIVIDKNITIDFNGNTYDIVGPAVGSAGTTTLGFQILSGNTVTLKDGTITESAPEQNENGAIDAAVKMLVQNYSNLKLEDMVLDGRGLGDGRYVLSNNCGNITITGETEIIAPAVKGIAFDVYRFGSYDAPTVTFDAGFKGGAKGAFEVSEGLEGKLKIHAGYFTQDPTAYVVEGKEVKVIDKDGYKYMVGDPVIDPTPSTSSSKKSSKKYSVDIEDTEDGTVKASSTRVKKDATVTLTVTPDEGYELDDLVVLDKDGEKVKLKDKGNGKYTFTMPRGGVEVEASFVEKEGEKEPVATEKEFIKLTIGQKIVWIFDEYVVNDVAPEIKNDRTMLPIRIIAEALGAKVTWNEAEQKVTIAEDDLTIEIFIGQPFATVNGKPVQLDAPAYIANGRTYLPLRFVAENLGATVEWNAADSSVTIFK